MQVKTILNRVQKFKSFVYEAVRFNDTACEPTWKWRCGREGIVNRCVRVAVGAGLATTGLG